MCDLALCYLGQLWLGEARLAHLGRLAHRDVTLSQRPLGERLGGPVLAGLAVRSVSLVTRATHPLSATTPGLSLHSTTAFMERSKTHGVKTIKSLQLM